MSSDFQFAVLGSGSKGNAILIKAGDDTVLLDPGLSTKQLELRMRAVDCEPSDIKHICITHEHSDHVQGLKVFGKRYPSKIYLTHNNYRWCLSKHEETYRAAGFASKFCIIEPKQTFTVGELKITAFRVNHDAVEPVVYRFDYQGKSFGVLTDLGQFSPELLTAFARVDALILETNYDDDLLASDIKRPFALKQRIASQYGHLSNSEAAEVLAELIKHNQGRLENIILGHLSADCNTPELARAAISPVLQKASQTIRCQVAGPTDPIDWVVI